MNSSRRLLACLLVAAGLLPACARPVTPPATLAPDIGKRLVAPNGIVSSAHPLASDAGLAMLRQGGNAIDAAVATAFAVGVVEPHMSGIGGSGAMLVWLDEQERAEYLDFYASQPVAAFVDAPAASPASAPLRDAGVPGEVAGLLLAHERFGRLPLATVMAPSIRLAEEGFAHYQVLAEMVVRDTVRLRADPVGRALFWRGDELIVPGDRIVNRELADVLRRIAAGGRDAFYTGEVARAVVERMNAGGHPVSMGEFAAYQPVWRRPLCTTYRGDVLLSAPPPQGGMQLLHSLELLEPYDLQALGLPTRSARAFDVFTSALRVGEAGARGNGDPRWMQVPARGIASTDYARSRAALVGTGRAPDSAAVGRAASHDVAASPAPCQPFEPYGAASAGGGVGSAAGGVPAAGAFAPGGVAGGDGPDGVSGGETTHISVVDADGNAVSLTITNSSVFGNKVGVLGFFLNDSGISTFRAVDLARAGAPAWRTRTSTIAPTLVMREDDVQMVVGSPGGGRIPLAMMQTMSFVLDYGLDPLAALRMPRVYPDWATRRVELEGGFDPAVLGEVRAMGYIPTADPFGYARLYMIARAGDLWIGAADPRHDGQVRGY